MFYSASCDYEKICLGPNTKALKEREEGIQSALEEAEEAKKQISEATLKVEKILEEGKKEKEQLVKKQLELSEYSKNKRGKINMQIQGKLDSASDINQQKRAAIEELRASVAELSIEIAKKFLTKN